MNRPLCKTCPYWDQFGGNAPARGECHRNGPVYRSPSEADDVYAWGDWPVTLEDEWCGEHPAMARWIESAQLNIHDPVVVQVDP